MQMYALNIPPTLRWWLARVKPSLAGFRRRTLGIALGVLMLLLLVVNLLAGESRVPNGGGGRGGGDVSTSYGPRNRTLGFEKIFYLSMKQ